MTVPAEVVRLRDARPIGGTLSVSGLPEHGSPMVSVVLRNPREERSILMRITQRRYAIKRGPGDLGRNAVIEENGGRASSLDRPAGRVRLASSAPGRDAD